MRPRIIGAAAKGRGKSARGDVIERGAVSLKRGIWAETARGEVLRDAATWRLLARHGLEAAVAVRPHHVDEVARWADAARAAGVRTSVWPMIEDHEGRWLSVKNVGPFASFVREVRRAAPGTELVLDLEPPFPLVRGALDGSKRAMMGLLALARDTEARRAGQLAIARLCDEAIAAGSAIMIAVVPFVLFDGPGSDGAWARLCGAPRDLPAARLNVMLYTSLIEGYSRGALRREDARALLAEGCRASVAAFGERACVSLGAAGPGALGDEPVYADPAALAEDVAIAVGEGVSDLWLFDLGGVLARGAPEPWIEALTGVGARSVVAPSTPRSRAASAAMWAMGRLLGAGAEMRAIAEYGTFDAGL